MLTVSSFVSLAPGARFATTPFFPFFALSALWMLLHPARRNTNNNSVMFAPPLRTSQSHSSNRPFRTKRTSKKKKKSNESRFSAFSFSFLRVGFKLRGFGFIKRAQDVGGVP